MRLTLATALSLLIAACGGATVDDVAAAPEVDPVTSTTMVQPTSTAPPVVSIETAESPFGPVLVDADGRTLYVFTSDQGSESSCYDACESNWPPVQAGLVAGEGVEVALGSTVRVTGSEQLTVNGRPVYLFAGDAGPGDVNGQGVGDVWFVIDPHGEPVGIPIEDVGTEDPEEGFYDY